MYGKLPANLGMRNTCVFARSISFLGTIFFNVNERTDV